MSITLINAFSVPEGKLDECVEFWKKYNDALKEEDGYISTKLHQSIDNNATFELVNVAQWSSESAYKAAIQKVSTNLKDINVVGLKYTPSLYSVLIEDTKEIAEAN
jgi:quinol monooxygenase YgiN